MAELKIHRSLRQAQSPTAKVMSFLFVPKALLLWLCIGEALCAERGQKRASGLFCSKRGQKRASGLLCSKRQKTARQELSEKWGDLPKPLVLGVGPFCGGAIAMANKALHKSIATPAERLLNLPHLKLFNREGDEKSMSYEFQASVPPGTDAPLLGLKLPRTNLGEFEQGIYYEIALDRNSLCDVISELS